MKILPRSVQVDVSGATVLINQEFILLTKDLEGFDIKNAQDLRTKVLELVETSKEVTKIVSNVEGIKLMDIISIVELKEFLKTASTEEAIAVAETGMPENLVKIVKDLQSSLENGTPGEGLDQLAEALKALGKEREDVSSDSTKKALAGALDGIKELKESFGKLEELSEKIENLPEESDEIISEREMIDLILESPQEKEDSLLRLFELYVQHDRVIMSLKDRAEILMKAPKDKEEAIFNIFEL